MTAAQHLNDRYARLTPQQRAVADFMLAHPFEAATLSIDAMAQRCAVSAATMNRFARALEYAGYSALREDWQRLLRGTTPSVEKLQTQRALATEPLGRMQASMLGGAEQVRAAVSLLHAEALQQVSRRLAEAPRIAVLGGDVSAYLASYFASYASLFRAGVDAISGPGGSSEADRRVRALNAGDVLVAIALPRYSALTVDLCALARERQVTVIAVTDSPASPLVPLADHTLLAPSQQSMLPASSIGVVALLEGMCVLIAAHTPRSREELLALAFGASRFNVDPLPRRARG